MWDIVYVCGSVAVAALQGIWVHLCVCLKWTVASIHKARAEVDRSEIWRQWVVENQENMEGKMANVAQEELQV